MQAFKDREDFELLLDSESSLICPCCVGSGEGRYDGSICACCQGFGVEEFTEEEIITKFGLIRCRDCEEKKEPSEDCVCNGAGYFLPDDE